MNDWFQTAAVVRLHLQNRIVIIPLCVTAKYGIPEGQERPRVSATQSLPTHHPLSNNTDVLRLLRHWLTSFKLKLLVSLHHLCGHHALDLQRERRRERNKQVTVHIYRQRLRGAITHPGSEYHSQNNVKFQFPRRSELAACLPIRSSMPIEKKIQLPGCIQGAYTAPVKGKCTHLVMKWAFRFCKQAVNYKVKALPSEQ